MTFGGGGDGDYAFGTIVFDEFKLTGSLNQLTNPGFELEDAQAVPMPPELHNVPRVHNHLTKHLQKPAPILPSFSCSNTHKVFQETKYSYF